MPRTAFALVSCRGDVHSAGSSAECAGRKSVCAIVATTASAYVTAAGPSAAVTAAAAPSVTARTSPTPVRTCSRRTRSATVARNGARSAAAAIRAPVTTPTATTPPSRNATTASPTMNAVSLAHIAPNEACARRSDPLCATSPRAPAQSRILAMGRLSQSSRSDCAVQPASRVVAVPPM